MSADGITLKTEPSEMSAEFGRRCANIGEEHQDAAMRHPSFEADQLALLTRLAREFRASLSLLERDPRFTVPLGTHDTKEELVKAVESEGHQLSRYAKSVVAHPQWGVVGPQSLDLYTGTVYEITGSKGRTTWREVLAKLDQLGFGKCPHETALQLRRVNIDQPLGEWLIVVTEPLADSNGHLSVLHVSRHSDGSWVYSYYLHPDYELDGDDRLVFRRK